MHVIVKTTQDHAKNICNALMKLDGECRLVAIPTKDIDPTIIPDRNKWAVVSRTPMHPNKLQYLSRKALGLLRRLKEERA